MNSKQAKELSLPEFLGRLGYKPARIRGADAWYTSPFRPNEHTPSFKIDQGRNIWFDHGLGAGGTIIDFVRHLYRTEDVARVLSIIAGVSDGPQREQCFQGDPDWLKAECSTDPNSTAR